VLFNNGLAKGRQREEGAHYYQPAVRQPRADAGDLLLPEDADVADAQQVAVLSILVPPDFGKFSKLNRAQSDFIQFGGFAPQKVSQTVQTSNSLGWSKKIQFLQNAGNTNKIFFSFLSIPISTSIPTYCVNIYRFIRPKIRLQCVFLCKKSKDFPGSYLS
jgi:hypothetical protein